MAGHPIYVDPPSRDMTAAEERQRELDEQISAFLAKGGEIKAFDPQRRPIEATPWAAFQVSPNKAKARVAPARKAGPKARAVAVPPPEVAGKPIAEPVPEPSVAPAPAVVTEPATADQAERVIAKIFAPENCYSEVAQALRELRKHAVAMHLVLDRLGVRR